MQSGGCLRVRVFAVAAGGQASGGMLLLQSGACLRWPVWASKRRQCVFCKTVSVSGCGRCGQASWGMLLLRSGVCWRLRLWASKRRHASFAKRRLFAVVAGGKQAGACFFCKAVLVSGCGWGQESRGMLLLRSGGCLRWRIWVSWRRHVVFCKAVLVSGGRLG